MRRLHNWLHRLAISLLVAAMPATAAMAQSVEDIAGATEQLAEARDLGQVLSWQVLFDEPRPSRVPLGPLTALGMVDDWANVDGTGSRSWYLRRGGVRQMEGMFRRQRELLERAGFEIRAAGFSQDRSGSGVGSLAWVDLYLSVNGLPAGAPILSAPEAPQRGAIVASREGPAGTLWAVVLLLQPEERQIGTLVDLSQALRTGAPPALGAEALQRAMAMHGHVALDGLTYVGESGGLAPGSEPVLRIVARYLQANVRQSFRVVGHSDESAPLDTAQRETQRQAEAVVTALVERYGASRERLRAFGMGPLSPIFPNDTQAGRERNRRVELVAGP
ncbi:MAG: OmpA family protein [Rhodobacteraceae bacterium]|nr:OmpA family protein [Paracoccaceae bacterium]